MHAPTGWRNLSLFVASWIRLNLLAPQKPWLGFGWRNQRWTSRQSKRYCSPPVKQTRRRTGEIFKLIQLSSVYVFEYLVVARNRRGDKRRSGGAD